MYRWNALFFCFVAFAGVCTIKMGVSDENCVISDTPDPSHKNRIKFSYFSYQVHYSVKKCSIVNHSWKKSVFFLQTFSTHQFWELHVKIHFIHTYIHKYKYLIRNLKITSDHKIIFCYLSLSKTQYLIIGIHVYKLKKSWYKTWSFGN